jgi:hypothetical protein
MLMFWECIPFPLDLTDRIYISILCSNPQHKQTTTYHFFFCFFAPVFAGAMVNVGVEMSKFKFPLYQRSIKSSLLLLPFDIEFSLEGTEALELDPTRLAHT